MLKSSLTDIFGYVLDMLYNSVYWSSLKPIRLNSHPLNFQILLSVLINEYVFASWALYYSLATLLWFCSKTYAVNVIFMLFHPLPSDSVDREILCKYLKV